MAAIRPWIFAYIFSDYCLDEAPAAAGVQTRCRHGADPNMCGGTEGGVNGATAEPGQIRRPR